MESTEKKLTLSNFILLKNSKGEVPVFKALEKLVQVSLNASSFLSMDIIQEALTAQNKHIESVHKRMLESYCDKDSNGKPVIVDNTYQLNEENMKKFNEEFTALMQLTFDIPGVEKITIPESCDKLTYEDYAYLKSLISNEYVMESDAKLTVSNIVFLKSPEGEVPIFKVLDKVLNINMTLANYKRLEVIQAALIQQNRVVEEEHRRILEAYCDKDAEGKPVIVDNRYQFNDENVQKFNEEFSKVIQGTFEIPKAEKIKISKDCTELTYVDYSFLRGLVEIA